jgi:thioredoxin reductase (NADPH)
MDKHYDVVVLGGGPAGLSAGIYLSRSRLNALILSEGVTGGQMVLTHEIANYPGVEAMSGYQLAAVMKRQAKSFGCDIKSNVTIESIDISGDVKRFVLKGGDSYTSDAVIIASGGRSRTLGVTGEEDYRGKGISYCATCDGDFFTDKEIFVVGGGNSALEEAVSLTKYVKKLTIVHQFDHFQAFKHAVNEAKNNPKINFMMESEISAFYGDEKLRSVDILDKRSGEKKNYPTDGVFVFIGYVPNTEFLEGIVEMNGQSEIVVDSNLATSVPGVYAAGDSIAKRYRQVTTAVSDGTIAALSAAAYINEKKR